MAAARPELIADQLARLGPCWGPKGCGQRGVLLVFGSADLARHPRSTGSAINATLAHQPEHGEAAANGE